MKQLEQRNAVSFMQHTVGGMRETARACRGARLPNVCLWEAEVPYAYSARVRHVPSTWTVINQARISSTSIRAVCHMAKTNTHRNTLAHARP